MPRYYNNKSGSNSSKRFELASAINEYDRYIRTNIASNIPKVYNDLRVHLLDEIYNLNKELIIARLNKNEKRIDAINNMLIILTLIDKITEDIMFLCPNLKEKVITSISYLDKITRKTYSFKNNSGIDE